MSAPRALIAGAGIGGLCAALCLAREGWRVSIFEKAPELQEAGAGLQLSPNASAILCRLGVVEALRAASLSPRAIHVRRGSDGATLAYLPLGDAEERWGAPYLVAHRADLQRALLDAVAREDLIELRAGAAVADCIETAGGVAVMVKHDGGEEEAEGDCLIGADGSRSTLRRRIVAGRADPAKSATRWAWRTLIEASRVPAEMKREESALWLGPRAHLVHYPLRGGAVINVVAVVEDNSADQSAAGWSTPGDSAALEARFADWADPARNLLAAASIWRKWPLFDRDPIQTWSTGRVALLGDAAHPMLPFLAQGAAQAIEDAGALGQALSGCASDGVAAGLAAYQAARRGRAARVQLESRRQAFIYHLSGVAALARNAAFRALGGERMLARYDWLYDARRLGADPIA